MKNLIVLMGMVVLLAACAKEDVAHTPTAPVENLVEVHNDGKVSYTYDANSLKVVGDITTVTLIEVPTAELAGSSKIARVVDVVEFNCTLGEFKTDSREIIHTNGISEVQQLQPEFRPIEPRYFSGGVAAKICPDGVRPSITT